MPTLNRDQVTYYLDKKIWRDAHRISEARGDAPPIVYYWWLGGDLVTARVARGRLDDLRPLDLTPPPTNVKAGGLGV